MMNASRPGLVDSDSKDQLVSLDEVDHQVSKNDGHSLPSLEGDAGIHRLAIRDPTGSQLQDLPVRNKANANAMRGDASPTPESKLPPEILGKIFFFHICQCRDPQNHGILCSPDISRQKTLHLLRVCRRWRLVALGTPQLWTRLTLQGDGLAGRTSTSPLATLPMWLDHSGSLPMELHIENYPSVYSPPEPLEKQEVFRQLTRNFLRFRSIHARQVPLRELFPPGITTRLPSLTRLVVHSINYPQEGFGHVAVPNLEELELAGFPWRHWVSFDPSGLRKIQLYRGEDAPADFICLFQTCHNLEECDLNYPGVRMMVPFGTHSIKMSKLRRFALTWSIHAPFKFLAALNVPELEMLRLYYPGARASLQRIVPTLRSLLATAVSLKELVLQGLDVCHDDIFPVIRELKFLEDLHFNGYMDDRLLAALTPQRQTRDAIRFCCPRLTNMTFLYTRKISMDALIPMLESRCNVPKDSEVERRSLMVSLDQCKGISHEDQVVLMDLQRSYQGQLSMEIRVWRDPTEE